MGQQSSNDRMIIGGALLLVLVLALCGLGGGCGMLMFASQSAPRAAPAPQPGAQPWSPPQFVVAISKVRRDPDALAIEGTEDGAASTIRTYDVDGWGTFNTRQSKSSSGAWAAFLSGAQGWRCDGQLFAPEAEKFAVAGGARYYRLKGGPLDGMLVKAFEREGSACMIIVGTDTHAQRENWPR